MKLKKTLITSFLVILIFSILSQPCCLKQIVYAEEIDSISITRMYPFDLKINLMPVNVKPNFKFNCNIIKGENFSNIKLEDSSNNLVSISCSLENDDNKNTNILVIKPSKDLKYNSKYKLIIPKDAVESSDSKTMSEDYILSFTTDTEFKRLGGKNRYETAVQVSQEGWPEGSKNLVLACGDDFPDALSAVPLAKKYNAPILLTSSKILNSETLNEIIRLSPENIYLIGGKAVISSYIEQFLISKNYNCKRIYGNNRYETAVAVAEAMGTVKEIVLASGSSFADALSISPFAGYYGVPILLSSSNKLPDCVLNYINKHKIEDAVIIGGTGAISSNIEKILPSPQRICGKNRYETNFEIISTLDADGTYSFFATGRNFPDALAGSALACYYYSPIILIDETMDKNILETWRFNKKYFKMKYILGQDNVVPSSLLEKIFEKKIE